MDFIGKTALENYQNYVKNGDNFQQRMFFTDLERKDLEARGLDPDKQYGDPLGMKKTVPVNEAKIQEPVKAGPRPS